MISLTEQIVRFKIEVGVEEKTLNTRKMAIPAADDAIIMTYINTQRSSSKYTIRPAGQK